MSRQRKTTPPPYFWKVPVPEKDHMADNYRLMKKIAVEGQRRRHEPLKANFIPGVTKSTKYAHVQSKVGAFLKGEQPLPHRSVSDDLSNRRYQQSQKFAVNDGNGRQQNQINRSAPPRGGNALGGGPARLSRSSVDLRSQNREDPRYSKNNPIPIRRHGSITNTSEKSMQGGPGPASYHGNQNHGIPNFQVLHPNPPDESIYKWKFSDDPPLVRHQHEDFIHHNDNPPPPESHCHRVEYLPCDGICADETVEPDTNPDSARSNSSRTSRGCNTEETRIFPESTKASISNGQRNPVVPPYHYRSMSIGTQDAPLSELSRSALDLPSSVQYVEPKKLQRGIHTINGFNNNGNDVGSNTNGFFGAGGDRAEKFDNKKTFSEIANRSSQNYNIVTNGDFESKMRGLDIRSRASESQQSLYKNNNRDGGARLQNPMRFGTAGSQQQIPIEMGPAGDLPHSLGTVPKYLKQRQEAWRVEEEAKKEAEKNAHIPAGYMQMSENERMENLKSFKKNYDILIGELNRIPIRIDTMRVRNHKVELEKQLTRLEDAMKTFSRPNVWVKVDD